MRTTPVKRGQARTLFSPTGYERKFAAAVSGAKLITRTASAIQTPDVVHLPTDKPAIIAANHSSLYDLVASLVMLSNFGITARIGVNKRFFNNPVMGAFLRGIGSVPFAKGEGQKAEDEMVAALLDGQVVALMPEGRITRPEDQVNGVGPSRPGISRIARRAEAAIVPVGFAGADEAWVPGSPLPKLRLGKHRVIVSIGAPIELLGDDHVANSELVMKEIGALVMAGRNALS